MKRGEEVLGVALVDRLVMSFHTEKEREHLSREEID
jgi:hypothetical protein